MSTFNSLKFLYSNNINSPTCISENIDCLCLKYYHKSESKQFNNNSTIYFVVIYKKYLYIVEYSFINFLFQTCLFYQNMHVF